MSTPPPYRAPAPPEAAPIIATTAQDVPGFRVVQIIGLVHGAAGLDQVAFSSAKLVKLQLEARKNALAAMLEEARGLRAHAVIAARYETTAPFCVAYGTAVRLEQV